VVGFCGAINAPNFSGNLKLQKASYFLLVLVSEVDAQNGETDIRF